MKESFLNRATENLKAAELLFENEFYNASANRAYYAAFHIAIAAIYNIGVIPNIDHKTVQSLFFDNYFNRRKIFPSKYKEYLSDIQVIRNSADYKQGISKRISKEQLKLAKEFFELVKSSIEK
jgi:uncharacterized protein (UPF0332 family)